MCASLPSVKEECIININKNDSYNFGNNLKKEQTRCNSHMQKTETLQRAPTEVNKQQRMISATNKNQQEALLN